MICTSSNQTTMSSFWKGFLEVTTGVIGTPIAAIGATYNALTSNKTISEAWDDAESKLNKVVDEAGDFGKKHGKEIGHGVHHVAKHLLTRK
jgi:hypothetical protein